jgi:ABC-type transport system involved in multi-copper enzyme maturation permease subunit
MIGQLNSESLKLRTTRTIAALLLAAAGFTLLGALVEGFSRSVHELAQEHHQRTMFSAAGSSAVLFATIAGLIIVTSEFRYGTIRPTLVFEPRRRVVLAAKLIAAALSGVVFAAVCVALAFAAGLAVLAARNVDVSLTAAHALVLVCGPILACALGAMLGAAVGTLIRNQVGAIVAVAAYAFTVDAVLFSSVPSIGRYLPGKASDALAGLPTEHLLAPAVGAAVYLAWTLVLLALATARNDRTDI